MTDRLARVLPRLQRSARSPLAVALLAAVLLHGLVLAFVRVRSQRADAFIAPAPAPDNTPELLRLSRRASVQASLTTLPLPPANQLLPPPPPLPPAGAGRSKRPPSAARPAASQSLPSSRRPAARPPQLAAARRTRGGQPRLTRPKQASLAAQLDALTPVEPAGLAEARISLDRLLSGAAAVDPPEPASLASLLAAAVVVERADLPEGLTLRRLPAASAAAPEVAPGQQRSLRWRNRLLVIWMEAEQLWILERGGDERAGQVPG